MKQVSSAQSWKEKKLLCDSSLSYLIDVTLTPKKWWEKTFLNEIKASMSFIPMHGMRLWHPIIKKMDYYMNPCLSQLKDVLQN